MLTVRRSAARGASRIAWLDSKHTFSFSEYHDPAHMGFRALRVINEDKVTAGAGFPTHGHRDMEILTYVLDGALAHQDSIGSSAVIPVGDAQRMTAGTGVQHSEFNASKDAPVHFLQIWIIPAQRGLAPGYEQKSFKGDGLEIIASPDGRDGSLTVHQDVVLRAGRLAAGARVTHALASGRGAWIQVARGAVSVGETKLVAGDGAALEAVERVELVADEASEVLLFDLG